MAKEQEKGIAAATGFGLFVPKAILQNQALLLRFWADDIEKFAQFYESGAETLQSRVEREVQRSDAA